MIIYVFEGKYGFQRLGTQGLLRHKLRGILTGGENALMSIFWGAPSPYIEAVPSVSSLEKDRGKKVFVVLRAAKDVKNSRYTAGIKMISTLNISGEPYKFGITTEFWEDMRATFKNKVEINAVFPAAPLLYFFLYSHPIGAEALRNGAIGGIDVGFKHTVYLSITGKKVKFFTNNYGVYDAIDKMAIGTGISFDKAKEMWFQGQPDYYQEIRSSLSSALSGKASFMNASKVIFLSGVSMIPPAGEEFRDVSSSKIILGAKALSPYILYSMVLREAGFKNILPVRGNGGNEAENEYALLLAAYTVIKSKRYRKKRR